jgi:hypothetical protein
MAVSILKVMPLLFANHYAWVIAGRRGELRKVAEM